MSSEKFRRQLRREAKLWQSEALITPTQYHLLAERYQFEALETAARNRFLVILVGLGSILLGLGAITFVAANWQAWPRVLKTLLLFGLFVAVNATGFYCWRSPAPSVRTTRQTERRQRLGLGLLLLGALLLGANMALMAQMFHISGSPYELLLPWGLGVLVMAASLRLTPLGVLGTILLTSGYALGSVTLFQPGELTVFHLFVTHMPVCASLLLVPLAYWCRTRIIFTLAALLMTGALLVNLGATAWPLGIRLAIAFTLPPALLWGYDDCLWPGITSRHFRPLARSLALLYCGALFYSNSFHWFWWETASHQGNVRDALGVGLPWLDIVLLGGWAIIEWFFLLRRVKGDLTTMVIAGLLGVMALIPLWHFLINPIPILATLLFNGLLFLLAVGLLRDGLAIGQRSAFWGGMALLMLQLLSRMLEYDTGLLLKSLVCILCGAGVIVMGLWFERHLSTIRLFEETTQ